MTASARRVTQRPSKILFSCTTHLNSFEGSSQRESYHGTRQATAPDLATAAFKRPSNGHDDDGEDNEYVDG